MKGELFTWAEVSKQLTPEAFQTSSGCFPRITERLLIYSLSLTLSIHLASHLCWGHRDDLYGPALRACTV